LGLFFLLTTGILGAYISLFGETVLLPIARNDAMSDFQIIIPVFAAHLTIIFKWFTSEAVDEEDAMVNLPKWVVIGPPGMVVFILLLTIGWLISSNSGEKPGGWIDASSFKGILTFCVALLNCTTILKIIKYFDVRKTNRSGTRRSSGSNSNPKATSKSPEYITYADV
jgi:hypothetical protein